MKKTILRIFAVILLIIGTIWFFQGIGVIKGSFMTGTTQWTVIGAICVVISIVLLRAARK